MFVRASALTTLALAVLTAGSAWADPVHVRGTVTKVDGSTVTVHTRENRDVTLTLGEAWTISGVVKADLSDIKPGSFIGTANVPGPDGAKALEVVVFPEALRGRGEGDRGWDLKPGSSMTNATVSNPVQGVDGRTVTLSYKGGQKTVTIPPDAPIVTLVSGTPGDVTAGAKVFILAEGGQDGGARLDKGYLAVGKDGLTPPM